jgi:hypothetical protein
LHIVLVTSEINSLPKNYLYSTMYCNIEIPLSKDTVSCLFGCRYVFKVVAVPFI